MLGQVDDGHTAVADEGFYLIGIVKGCGHICITPAKHLAIIILLHQKLIYYLGINLIPP